MAKYITLDNLSTFLTQLKDKDLAPRSWIAKTTVNAWSRVVSFNGYQSFILTVTFDQSSQASTHTYMVSTGYQCGKITQLFYNGYSGNSAIKVRLTQDSNHKYFIELQNPYGYNGASIVNAYCKLTRLDAHNLATVNNTITLIYSYTAGGDTVRSELTSSSTTAVNLNVSSAIKATQDSDGNTINTTYLKLSGGTLTGPLTIKGNAASNPLMARGIVGSDGSGNVGPLYLQYGVNNVIHLGNGGDYTISEDGGRYSGNAATATTATNLAAGAAGSIPYQTAAGATAMLAKGSNGQVLNINSSGVPAWTTDISGNSGSTTYVKSEGRLTAETTTNRAAGLRHYAIYSNGYPFTYGNVLQVNGANGVGQLAMQWHGIGLAYRSAPDTSTTFSEWATLITDKNYTSYTVKKDGTGASGTWGINISGNAGTATNASKLSDWTKTEIQTTPNANLYTLFDTTPMLMDGVNLSDKCTVVTAPDNNSPFANVWCYTGYTVWYSKDLAFTPGETICIESWVMRKSGATGTNGSYYIGIRLRDKNNKPINNNGGTIYPSQHSGYSIPTDGKWYRRYDEFIIPTTHTAYNGSDGGPCYRGDVRMELNFSSGTIPTYFGGVRIYKRIMAKTDEVGGIKVAGTRTSAITTTQGGTTSNRYYGVEIDSSGRAFVNVPWTDTNTDTNTTYTAGTGLTLSNTTFKAKLKSEIAATYDSASVTNTQNRQYAVVPDKSGYLSVNVPWTDANNYTLPTTSNSNAAPTISALTADYITELTSTALTTIKVTGFATASTSRLTTYGLIFNATSNTTFAWPTSVLWAGGEAPCGNGTAIGAGFYEIIFTYTPNLKKYTATWAKYS